MAFKRANREIVQNIKKGYYYRKMPPALQKGYEIAAEGILSFHKIQPKRLRPKGFHKVSMF